MSNERNDERETDRMLTRLFAHAKPRPQPPAHDAEEIRRAVLAEWEAVSQRRTWRRRGGFAAAASVVLAAALWFSGGWNSSVPPVAVATVERVQGDIGAGDARLAVGSVVSAGSVVTTGTGQVALGLAGGGSLRLGPGSRLVLTSADAAMLTAGVLYFDSEDRPVGVPFMVTTELGVVRDVGTQFFVRLDDEQDLLDVGVREGRVALARDGQAETARAGERLVARQGDAAIGRDLVATFGPDWDWAEKLAPPFDIDGRTVSEFLVWFGAQTGRAIEFAGPEAEQAARDNVLRGSIDLEPFQKLEAVLAVTNLSYSLDGNRVVIAMR